MTRTENYADVIAKTTAMVRDKPVQRLAEKHGLHVLDVTWEDTARFDNSAVGPNISDMTIQVQHMVDIAGQINKVYQQADYVGSLVVEGPTGRPTEYEGTHVEPPQWWDVFWQRHFQNTGQTREQTMEMLRKLLGAQWQESTLEQAEQAVSQGGQDDN